MLELIFQGFMEWAYGLALECWEYFSSSLLDIMSMDYAYMKSHVPVMVSIAQVLLAVGWALLIGNLVFQALKSMAVGLGFEGEDPKLLFTRTFVFAFLLMASPQICEVGLSLTARIIELLEIPDAINVTLVDEGVFGSLGAAWLLVIIFGLIIMLKVFRLLLEIAERYVILAVLTMTAPLAFAMGGSKSTSEIFGGWCRMFGSMCTLMVTNVIFFKMLLSVLSNVPSGLDIIPWIVLVLTIVKVARKADAITGSVETFGYGWLHITLHTLLPHCRYQTPNCLSDTLRRLLDEYEACGKKLPFYSRAMLVIDEHTGIEGRHIYDQDNKGWKAISNAIKGRLIPDDDQHTLAVALLSTECFEHECCHITLLPLEDAHDFFAAHSSDYASQDFYSGQWC